MEEQQYTVTALFNQQSIVYILTVDGWIPDGQESPDVVSKFTRSELLDELYLLEKVGRCDGIDRMEVIKV